MILYYLVHTLVQPVAPLIFYSGYSERETLGLNGAGFITGWMPFLSPASSVRAIDPGKSPTGICAFLIHDLIPGGRIV